MAVSHSRDRARVRGKLSRCVSQPTPSPITTSTNGTPASTSRRAIRQPCPKLPALAAAGLLARRPARGRGRPAGRRPSRTASGSRDRSNACFCSAFISRTARSIAERCASPAALRYGSWNGLLELLQQVHLPAELLPASRPAR